MKDLVIFGTGGLAREVQQIVEDINKEAKTWNLLGFIDDNAERHGMLLNGLSVFDPIKFLTKYTQTHVVIALGNPPIRYQVQRQLQEMVTSFASVLHPNAYIGDRVIIGEGSIVFSGVQITSEVSIGKHVILNPNATVSHDSTIEDYVALAPGVNIAGRVCVKQGCDLGVNSCIIPRVTVGKWSIIGAGAVVTRDIPDNVTVVGVPAKIIKERKSDWHEQI